MVSLGCQPFYERALAAPRTVSPDKLAQSGKKATIETLTDKQVLRDDTHTLELHHIKYNTHHDGLILVYLPKEKVLIEADAYTPLLAFPSPHSTLILVDWDLQAQELVG
jgi:hypothetical protein